MALVNKPKKTKTGQYSTSEDVLSAIADKHEIIQDVLDYRGLVKLQNTYVDALPSQVENYRQGAHRLCTNHCRYRKIEFQQPKPSEHPNSNRKRATGSEGICAKR